MYLHEVHLRDGRKFSVRHPSPNPSQKDIAESLIAIGEAVVAGVIVKIITKGRTR
ncbi:hypothetical protein [Parvularcula marina]|uniref:hypothetical protein n=1 Tax=Parvularcula marina TaxID=2292771 RepID=UPI003515E68F